MRSTAFSPRLSCLEGDNFFVGRNADHNEKAEADQN